MINITSHQVLSSPTTLNRQINQFLYRSVQRTPARRTHHRPPTNSSSPCVCVRLSSNLLGDGEAISFDEDDFLNKETTPIIWEQNLFCLRQRTLNVGETQKPFLKNKEGVMETLFSHLSHSILSNSSIIIFSVKWESQTISTGTDNTICQQQVQYKSRTMRSRMNREPRGKGVIRLRI